MHWLKGEMVLKNLRAKTLSAMCFFLHRWLGRRLLENPQEFDPSTVSGLTATNVLNAGRAFAIS